MFESCYYNDDSCGGAMWHCRTCGEWFCESHQHTTDKGANVECVSCERERKENETKIVSFDFHMDTFVAVEAPKCTDPETLYEQAKELFKERVASGEFEIIFTEIFDPEE